MTAIHTPLGSTPIDERQENLPEHCRGTITIMEQPFHYGRNAYGLTLIPGEVPGPAIPPQAVDWMAIAAMEHASGKYDEQQGHAFAQARGACVLCINQEADPLARERAKQAKQEETARLLATASPKEALVEQYVATGDDEALNRAAEAGADAADAGDQAAELAVENPDDGYGPPDFSQVALAEHMDGTYTANYKKHTLTALALVCPRCAK